MGVISRARRVEREPGRKHHPKFSQGGFRTLHTNGIKERDKCVQGWGILILSFSQSLLGLRWCNRGSVERPKVLTGGHDNSILRPLESMQEVW